MSPASNEPDMSSLADIDQAIHNPVRLMLLSYLYVVERADYVFLKNMSELSWGNLATHLNKLEQSGYVEIEKSFIGKKPHSTVNLTPQGRQAFRAYKKKMQQVLDDLPD